MINGTEPAAMIVGCVTQLPSRFGIELISDGLRSSNSTKIQDYKIDILPAYGSGRKYGEAHYLMWTNELVCQGYTDRTGTKYPGFGGTVRSEGRLRGRSGVMLPVS